MHDHPVNERIRLLYLKFLDRIIARKPKKICEINSTHFHHVMLVHVYLLLYEELIGLPNPKKLVHIKS